MAIDFREQTFGVEIEFVNASRTLVLQALKVVLNGVVTTRVVVKNGRESRVDCVRASDGRFWDCVPDGSLSGANTGEVVTPILKYADMDTLQAVIRAIKSTGAKSSASDTCGIHVHIGANLHTPTSLRNLINLLASKEDMIYKSFCVNPSRVRYCAKICNEFLTLVNTKRPKTLGALADEWYRLYSGDDRNAHYNRSRYRGLNLHSVFSGHTVEFRLFNGCLHAGIIRAYVIWCMMVSSQAINQRSASPTRVTSPNPKYTYRCWLLRMGMIGEEFKNVRKHLLEPLEGDNAWLDTSIRGITQAVINNP